MKPRAATIYTALDLLDQVSRTSAADCLPLFQPRFNGPMGMKEKMAMMLLIVLALAGAISGSVSGAYMSGSDGIVLGAMTGMIFGTAVWMLTGSILRALREYRLNRYFRQDSADEV